MKLPAKVEEEIVELEVWFAPKGGQQVGTPRFRGLREAVAEALTAATAAQEAYRDKDERVFEAVVYAFEGRPVPDDLREHGMVRRALKYRAAQEAEIARLLDIETRYRRTLWLGHGCTHALYGDDGEMQCNDAGLHGLLDFKRDPLERLEQGIYDAKLVKLNRVGASHDESR